MNAEITIEPVDVILDDSQHRVHQLEVRYMQFATEEAAMEFQRLIEEVINKF